MRTLLPGPPLPNLQPFPVDGVRRSAHPRAFRRSASSSPRILTATSIATRSPSRPAPPRHTPVVNSSATAPHPHSHPVASGPLPSTVRKKPSLCTQIQQSCSDFLRSGHRNSPDRKPASEDPTRLQNYASRQKTTRNVATRDQPPVFSRTPGRQFASCGNPTYNAGILGVGFPESKGSRTRRGQWRPTPAIRIESRPYKR